MSIIPVFVGLDYHQNSVQVCVIDQSGKVLGNRGIANDACAIEEYCRRFGEPKRMGIEACCGSADLSEELVTQHQLPLQMAHAGYVNRMKKSPDKTDFGDAQMLADLARVNYLPEVWLAPEQTRQLRRLVRHRKQLVNRRKDVKLRIRGLLRENRLKYADAQSWTRRWLHWLEHIGTPGSLRSLDHQKSSERTGVPGRTDHRSRKRNSVRSQRRSHGCKIDGDVWCWVGHRGDVPSRSGACRTIQVRQTVGQVLWSYTTQRQQWNPSGRCWFNSSWQPGAANGPDRTGSPIDQYSPGTFGITDQTHVKKRQTQKRDRSSCGQSLGAKPVSPVKTIVIAWGVASRSNRQCQYRRRFITVNINMSNAWLLH